jgi:hypothetical protein
MHNGAVAIQGVSQPPGAPALLRRGDVLLRIDVLLRARWVSLVQLCSGLG